MVSERRFAGLIVAIIFVTTVGGAGYIGAFAPSDASDQPSGASTATVTSSQPRTSTPMPTPTRTPTRTRTSTRTPTPTATPTPTPRDRPVDRAAVIAGVERGLRTYLDDPRTTRDESLSVTSETALALATLAQRHSNQMAASGRVAHTIDGQSTADRYARFDETDDCEAIHPRGYYVASPEDMEAVTSVPVNRRSDAELATAIVYALVENADTRRTFWLDATSSMGVGVNVTDATAYVTVAVC